MRTYLHVLDALSRDRISDLTKESLIKAFHDDGISDLEMLAGKVVKQAKRDLDVSKTEPVGATIDSILSIKGEVSDDRIVHRPPKIPFTVGQTLYDPDDIRRFDGKPLLFFPGTSAPEKPTLRVFTADALPVVTSYLQMRAVANALHIADFGTGPYVPTSPPAGTPPGTGGNSGYQPIVGCGGLTGTPCGGDGSSSSPSAPSPPPAPSPPFTTDQVQMFDDANWSGNWFWLAKGYIWWDLTRVSRGGWFGGDWNDEISSLSATNTCCIFCENINLQGSMYFTYPNQGAANLDVYGWNDRISSVYNIG